MSRESNQEVIDALRVAVASTYALIGQLHLCHWNVRGSSFFPLHDAFEAQYSELFMYRNGNHLTLGPRRSVI